MPHLASLIKDAERFSGQLLRLCNDPVPDKRRESSIATHYPYMRQGLPTHMMIPLQDAMTGTLPSTPETLLSHNPFPAPVVGIRSKSSHNIADSQPSTIESTSCNLCKSPRKSSSSGLTASGIPSCASRTTICAKTPDSWTSIR